MKYFRRDPNPSHNASGVSIRLKIDYNIRFIWIWLPMLNEAISKMPKAFEARVLLRGQEYFEQGKVLNIRLSDGLLKGRVKGSSSQIYDVHMDLKAWPGKAAQCTCTYHSNCKHAAACLFALRDRELVNSNPSSEIRLDRKLDMWLKSLRNQENAVLKKQEVTHHLIYLIHLKLTGYEHKVSIQLALAKLLKKGGYGKKSPINGLSDSKKQHFIADDNEIVAQLLFKCGVTSWFDHLSIRNSELLERILATGRAFFVENESKPVILGEKEEGICQWVLAPNGNQQLVLLKQQKMISPLLIDACWYFDQKQAVMGCLDTPYPVNQLRHLLDAPPIPLDQAELLSQKMLNTCPEFPTPQIFKNRERASISPVPVVIFDALELESHHYMWNDNNENILFIVRIAFDYAGMKIQSNDLSEHVVQQKEDVLIEYKRDVVFEEQKIAELKQILDLRPTHAWETYRWQIDTKVEALVLNQVSAEDDLGFLYNQVIPQLETQGWHIELANPIYQEVINADELEWFSELEESSNDFFSYQLGILIEGKPVNVVPLVAQLIQNYSDQGIDGLSDQQLVKLPLNDGRVLQVELGRIKPLVRLLLQFGIRSIDEQEELRLSKYQLILMHEAELALAASKARWRGGEAFRNELKQLIQLNQLPETPIPQGLNAQLRDYQQAGLNWLQFLRSSRFGGVLADDMGLGKTIQTLAHLQHEKEQGRLVKPSLIIAPTSLVGNWYAEAKKFTPALSVLIHHGVDRHQDEFQGHDVVISTYGLIQRDKEKFIEQSFYYLILDEAQFIKNARTKTTQIIQQIPADHRLCLTGTPLENHLGELWSLFHFLMPGLLGDTKQFRQWFRTPIEKLGDSERRELLARRVKPFMLRRTKNEVANELPPKTEMMRMIDLGGPQRDLYEAIRMSMEKKVREAIAKQGLGKSHILLLDALLKLRQVCCDPRLLSLPQAEIAHGTSGKLDALMELLDNLMEEGRRVLVFSQFTSMLKLIEENLIERNYAYLKLTGQTQNRQALVESFQTGDTPIFLISLKAGGTGLNLTRADTVIHYDPWWNPAVEDQATDRTHRIGQENPVFVYKLITAGTVEEAILTMQQKKRQLVDGILSSDQTKTSALSEADLEQLFMPLE